MKTKQALSNAKKPNSLVKTWHRFVCLGIRARSIFNSEMSQLLISFSDFIFRIETRKENRQCDNIGLLP